MSKKIEPCGRAETFVGLYLAGEEHGQEVARRLDHLQLPQVARNVDRLALGLPLDAEQPAPEAIHHRPFEFSTTLASWSKLPGFFDHRSGSDSAAEDQTCVVLRLTLNELGKMAGQ